MNKPGLKIGCFLCPKDADHLSIPFKKNSNECHYENLYFKLLDQTELLSKGGEDCDIIIHKCSNFVKRSRAGDVDAIKVMEFFNSSPRSCMLDRTETVMRLADRVEMFKIMDSCKFVMDGVKVDVPRWEPISTAEDVKRVKTMNLEYPLICKAQCAGEGPGGHSMQLVFNPSQLDHLQVFPCVAQEFKNHNAIMTKIFVYGPSYFTCTRPSVRNFPTNGQPLHKIDSICFDSHDVAKLNSVTFLNNYQTNFTLRNSTHGDKILQDSVVVELLKRLSQSISFNFLGIDVLVTNGGSTYELVDVNYLPSYGGIDDRFQYLLRILDDFILNDRRLANYWT